MLPFGEADPALEPSPLPQAAARCPIPQGSESPAFPLRVPPAVSPWQVQGAVSSCLGSIWRGQRACEWCCCISQGLLAVRSLIREQKGLYFRLEVIKPVQADVYFLCSLE